MFKYNLNTSVGRINFDDSLDFEPTFNAAPEAWAEFDQDLADDVIEQELYVYEEQDLVGDLEEARSRMERKIREQWESWAASLLSEEEE